MENENKKIQGDEQEMQEKVRRDVSEKIAEAASVLQEEIEEAAAENAEIVEETAVSEEWEPAAEEFAAEEEEETVIPEPKKITLKLRNLVLSLVGTAVLGALALLLCMQIPSWVNWTPQGKTVATVEGVEITDMDMTSYIYLAANEYIAENGGVTKNPADYDWSLATEDGKTAAQVVKENAMEAAISDALLIRMADKNGAEWNASKEKKTIDLQFAQMLDTYGKELLVLNAKAQGLDSLRQYRRKVLTDTHLDVAQRDLEANAAKYYPEDLSILDEYAKDDMATVKHILIKSDADAAGSEDAKARAAEVLARAKNGEDFDALISEYNEDVAAPATGYTFGPGEMMPAFEEASFALAVNQISEIVETSYGYHIIKRIAGPAELEGYWRAQAKVRIKERAMEKLSVGDILKEIRDYTDEFQSKYMEYQQSQN